MIVPSVTGVVTILIMTGVVVMLVVTGWCVYQMNWMTNSSNQMNHIRNTMAQDGVVGMLTLTVVMTSMTTQWCCLVVFGWLHC